MEPQGFPQEEGSSSSSVDREAADEGYRAPPQTPGGQESKPSACPSPSEHSTAVLVESQGRARHASSVSEEELDETAEIVVAAVLLRSVAIMQGATRKEPTAPSAARPRVPPPTPEPVDCTAVDETGAVATPLATVPGHQVAAKQGGQAQSSCTKHTPADKPATCQKQEPSQGLLDGPIQSSEQGLGIHDLAQAPALQPRPTHVRRALRALHRALCCCFIAEEWEKQQCSSNVARWSWAGVFQDEGNEEEEGCLLLLRAGCSHPRVALQPDSPGRQGRHSWARLLGKKSLLPNEAGGKP
nr:uncharacterized protein LOC113842126 isoform X2 [Anas platyrhynchos]